ncbi:magnesium transporter [Methanobrevibacter boviskoreani]|uniref:magnesium transporter n=1 Tax=Methanobrevibacter boviskoreani TaxID=1348249 RepID=UPI00059426A5|nr:magnesium transporter [Methanobrevibacter boviskoreani]
MKYKTKVDKLPHIISVNKSFIRESLTALLICAVGDLCAGIILGNMTYFLDLFPGLLVLIPGAIGMRGNIFGSFASRLSTNLHIGTLDPEFKWSPILNTNLSASFILTMVLSLFLAIFAKLICFIFHLKCIGIMDIILISVFAGAISSIIMLPITFFISIKSYIGGWDPDNITTPIVAAFGDLFTLPAIIASIYILKLFINNYFIKTIIFVGVLIFIILLFVYAISSNEDIRLILRQSTPTLVLCSFLGIFAGFILDSCESTLLTNPTLLTLVPLFSGESGDLVSILGARLSSGLHSGLIEAEFRFTSQMKYNFFIIFLLSLIVYPFIAIIADISSALLGVQMFPMAQLILISMLAGLILIFIMMFIVFFIGVHSYNKGFDPDNVIIPVSTSLTDALSNSLLVVFSLIIIAIFI